MAKFKDLKRRDKILFVVKIFIVILGSFVVSFGNVAFLVPLDINAGGLSGIGIIIRYFSPAEYKTIAYNIFVAIASVVLWFLGRIFIGKEFAYKTLVATIAFPVANALFTLVPGISDGINWIGNLLATAANGPTAGNYLLAGLFGGVFVGFGVAITFVGGGSTGGVDVLTFLMDKYLHIKESAASFIVDGLIVLTGIFALVPRENEMLISCLAGIISAFVTALLIEFIYIGSQSSYQADIISEKWEEISRFAQDELERGATIIEAKGGYQGDKRIVLRVVMDRTQYEIFKRKVAEIDDKAFITYTQTSATFGEGFKNHYNIYKNKKTNKK